MLKKTLGGSFVSELILVANILFQIFHGDNKRTTELSRQKRGHRPQAADPWEALSYRQIQWWERRLSGRSGTSVLGVSFRGEEPYGLLPPKLGK